MCLFLWLLFQDAGVCQLCQLCHGKKIIVLPQRDHIPAGNRARTSIASGLHRPFIGWLLCDYCVVIVRYIRYVCAIFSYSNHYLYQNVCAAWLLHQPFSIQQRLVVELFNLVWNPLQRHNKFSKQWNIFQTLCNNCANLKRISTSSKQNHGVLVDIVSLCQCPFLHGFCAGRAQEVIGSKNSDFYMSMYRSDFFVIEKHKILKLASRCCKSGFSENS